MDTSASNPDSVKQGYLFELPVQKWSRTERAFKNRVLALTKSSVVEMDVVTRFVAILLPPAVMDRQNNQKQTKTVPGLFCWRLFIVLGAYL